MGLGYGGFFALWSGTKQYLPGKYAVLSALSLTISVFLFIAYQVLETACISHLYAGSAKITNPNDAPNAERFVKRSQRINRTLATAWPPVFYACVVTGFCGVVILTVGFCRALLALW
jgi:hypothetical protein